MIETWFISTCRTAVERQLRTALTCSSIGSLARYVEDREGGGGQEARRQQQDEGQRPAAGVARERVAEGAEWHQAQKHQADAAGTRLLAYPTPTPSVDAVATLGGGSRSSQGGGRAIVTLHTQELGLGIPEALQAFELLLEVGRQAFARVAGHYFGKVSRAIWFVAAVLGFAVLDACVTPRHRLPDDLREVSGLIALPDGGYVAVNDGGNPAAFHVLGTELQAVASVPLAAVNVDWEALASAHDGYVLCDIGDNLGVRDSVTVYRFTQRGKLLGRRSFTYPDGARDAEACFERGGRLHILTKAPVGFLGGGKRRVTRLYVEPEGNGRGSVTLDLVDSLALGAWSVTDVDVAGDRLVMLAYEFKQVVGLPVTRTILFEVGLTPQGRFAAGDLQSRRVRAPFTPTQYEALSVVDDSTVVIASERTFVVPPRWRRVPRP